MFGEKIQALKRLKPIIIGRLFKAIYNDKNVVIGKNFQCASIPDITLEKDSSLKINENVTIRKDVEIRIHKKSQLIIEDNCLIDRGVRLLVTNNSKLVLKQSAKIGLYSVLNGGDDIEVGQNALVSGFVYLQTSMHRFNDVNIEIQKQGYDHAPIVIGPDAWLGAHVVVLPGCSIGRGAIVGSNAVVTRDVPNRTIVAGVPATIIKERT